MTCARLASAALLAGLAACASAPREDGAPSAAAAADTILVTVRAPDGAPLAGAGVRVADTPPERWDWITVQFARPSADVVPWERAGTTDAAGDVRVGLGRGPFTVRVDRAGCVPALDDFGAFDLGRRDPIEIVLQPAARIEGRVVDAATGDAVAGARVECGPTQMTPWKFRGIERFGATTTDAAGRFLLDCAAPGEGTVVRAEAPSFARAHLDLKTPDAGATATIEIRVGRPVALRGFVRDASGAPVKGALVQAVARDPALVGWEIARWPWPCRSISDADAEGRTGDDGAFRLDGLASDTTYVVYALEHDRNEADPTNRVVSALRTGVRPGAEPGVDLVAEPYPRAFLRLVDASGAPLCGREVRVAVDGHSPYRSQTDADGWAQVAPELGGLRRGRVRVRLLNGSGHAAEVDVDMSDGKDARAEIAIPAR